MSPPLEDLRASEQTIECLMTPEYWQKCCPWLTCMETDRMKQKKCNKASNYEGNVINSNLYQDNLRDNGFFKINSLIEDGYIEQELIEKLEQGVKALKTI
eukprot:Pgem_evm1s15164